MPTRHPTPGGHSDPHRLFTRESGLRNNEPSVAKASRRTLPWLLGVHWRQLLSNCDVGGRGGKVVGRTRSDCHGKTDRIAVRWGLNGLAADRPGRRAGRLLGLDNEPEHSATDVDSRSGTPTRHPGCCVGVVLKASAATNSTSARRMSRWGRPRRRSRGTRRRSKPRRWWPNVQPPVGCPRALSAGPHGGIPLADIKVKNLAFPPTDSTALIRGGDIEVTAASGYTMTGAEVELL